LGQNKVSIKLTHGEVPELAVGQLSLVPRSDRWSTDSSRPSNGRRFTLSSLRTSWSVNGQRSRRNPCMLLSPTTHERGDLPELPHDPPRTVRSQILPDVLRALSGT